jgi:hypothetical protein
MTRGIETIKIRIAGMRKGELCICVRSHFESCHNELALENHLFHFSKIIKVGIIVIIRITHRACYGK